MASANGEPLRLFVGVEPRGLCSNYLAALPPGQKVLMRFCSDARMHVDQRPSLTPIFLVGAGSGITPFLGYLKHLSRSKQMARVGQANPPIVLYGFRGARVGEKILAEATNLSVADIRDADSSAKPKKHVQDLLEPEEVRALVQKGTMLICGSKVMIDGVETKLRQICEGQQLSQQFEAFRRTRFVPEYWGG